MAIYEDAANRDVLHETLFELSRSRFQEDIGRESTVEIESASLNQSAWLASLLAQSPDDDHRRLAFRFGVLLYLHNRNATAARMYREFANVIISRLASFPATGGLEPDESAEPLEDETVTLGGTLSAELAVREEAYRINPETVFTDFQRRIWDELQSERDLSISAPTSAGKSFAIREYVKDVATSEGTFRGIYIVPNRALISEVSSDFRKDVSPGVPVSTSGYADEIEGEDFLLVITPERCLHYLEEGSDGELDMLFLDELQKFEDNGRGPLFEYVIQELAGIHPGAQMISAGPYIDSPAEIFEATLSANGADRDVVEVGSKYTPVVHLESNFRINQSEDRVRIRFPGSSGMDEFSDVQSLSGKDTEEGRVQELIDDYGAGKQTLVYVSSRANAEDIANEVADTIQNWSPDDEITDLVEFITENIHEEFPLTEPLQDGVAYHHGGLPQIVRNELERLYRAETLHTIICTPTLLSGVNLPAEKLYVTDNRAGLTELSVFQIQNLVGRVGRVGKKPYGSVHYVDRESNPWADDYIGEIPEKEVVPATSRILTENSEELREVIEVEDPREDIEELNVDRETENGLKSTNVILRSRYLQNTEELKQFLDRKEIPADVKDTILDSLDRLIGPLSIPKIIVRRNPTINPVLQDEIYGEIHENPNAFLIRENSLRSDLFTVMDELNSVFEFANNPGKSFYPPHRPEMKNTLYAVVYMAHLWLKGISIAEIIQNRYENSSDSQKQAIENVMTGINRGIRFVFVKYIKLVGDIFMVSPDLQPTPTMGKLDKYLERGSLDPDIIDWIDLGIDRSVAITLRTGEIESLEDIRGSDHPFSGLQDRYLTDQGFIGDEES